MGHEIKKPATAITGYLDLIIDEIEKTDPGGKKELVGITANLQKARRECDSLSELNNIFLALLKLDRDREVLPLKKIALIVLIDEVLANLPLKYNASSRVHVNNTSGIKEIVFNPDALRLIVGNLIENALIYSGKKSDVLIDIEKVQDKRGMRNRELLKITVIDKGVGIPDEYLEKIFSPFVRLHKDKIEGTGLGLTLVRSLVELHQGQISLISKKDIGTTVHIIVPLLRDSSEQMVL